MSELGIFYPTIPEGDGATNVTLTADGDNLTGNISLADFKTALESGVVLLSFPTEGDADVKAVVEYTDDTTNGLKIGVFSEDEYIVYSVVDDGNDGVTLTVVSTKYMVEPYVIVPTFTSQTGGTVPAGTFAKLNEFIDHGIIVVEVDTSVTSGLPQGTIVSSFKLARNAQTNKIFANTWSVTSSLYQISKVTFYEIDIYNDDTFTMDTGIVAL